MAAEHLSDEALRCAAADNLATHATWVQQRARGMRAVVGDALTYGACGLACDTFNLVCRARLSREEAPAVIAAALAWYDGGREPFSWWLTPGDLPADLPRILADHGLEAAEGERAMVLALPDLPAAEPGPAGLVVRRVTTREQLSDFAAITSENWSPPDPHVCAFYDQAAAHVLSAGSPLHFYVGYVDGVPVASAEMTVTGKVVGLYGISTRAKHRRRGYGTALTVAPLREALAAGVTHAVLQATDAGAAVYARLGFRVTGEVVEYKLPA